MKTVTTFLAALLVSAVSAGAATIDFEALGADLGDNGEVTDEATADYGIRFRVNGTELARIAKIGAPRTAFEGYNGDDNPAPAYADRVGEYFLTDDGVLTTNVNSTLSILYDDPTKEASGDILDVDFGESYAIALYDVAGSLLDTLTVDENTQGARNGGAATWGFTRDSADVSRITISGAMGTGKFFGLGFDNFSYDVNTLAPVPVPLPAVMLLSGLGVMGAMRRRRKS